MKLEIHELPSESETQYLLTTEMMEKRGVTIYDVLYLLGRRSRQRSRLISVCHREVKDGILFSWSFDRDITKKSGLEHYKGDLVEAHI